MNVQTHELFGRDYFETYYSNYLLQNPAKKMGFYRMLAEGAVEGIERPRVLELGCAFGRFLSSLNPDWERFGLDVSEYAIGEATRAVLGARVCVSAAAEIPFEGPFDLIAAFDVLEHLPDLDQVAKSIRSKLTPSGSLIFVVPVYDGPTGPIIRRLDKDVTHIHKESRAFWLRWAGSNFIVREWWGIYRYLFPWGAYLHRPTRTLRRYTPAIAVVARTRETG